MKKNKNQQWCDICQHEYKNWYKHKLDVHRDVGLPYRKGPVARGET